MNPKFQRFLKETKQDQLQKERLERKAQKLAQKEAQLKEKEEMKRLKQLAKEEKLKAKELEKLLKQQAKEEKKSSTKTATAGKATINPPQPSELDNKKNEISWETQDLFSNPLPSQHVIEDIPKTGTTTEDTPLEQSSTKTQLQELGEPKSLFEMFRTEGDYKWLQPDCPATKAAFNLMNKSLHPERPLARGVAVLAVKGTSFDDKRLNCLNILSEVQAGEGSGEIKLVPEPENKFDPNAVAVYTTETNKMLGYIPKAHEINACYSKSLQEGGFCGGYIIEGKKGMLKGEENAMILIATGWL